MHCKHHAEVAAAGRCAGCAESFCGNCLVEIEGERYCADCKIMALKGRPLIAPTGKTRCTEAHAALVMGMIAVLLPPVVALFIIGILILSVIALTKSAAARRMIKADPHLTGWGKAIAGTAFGILGLVFLALSILQVIAAGGV
jgi:hypothetical protein